MSLLKLIENILFDLVCATNEGWLSLFLFVSVFVCAFGNTVVNSRFTVRTMMTKNIVIIFYFFE